jgi:hypothetical protein
VRLLRSRDRGKGGSPRRKIARGCAFLSQTEARSHPFRTRRAARQSKPVASEKNGVASKSMSRENRDNPGRLNGPDARKASPQRAATNIPRTRRSTAMRMDFMTSKRYREGRRTPGVGQTSGAPVGQNPRDTFVERDTGGWGGGPWNWAEGGPGRRVG